MRPPAWPLPEARKGILRPLRRDLGIGLRAGEIGAIKWAKDELIPPPKNPCGALLHRQALRSSRDFKTSSNMR